MSCGTVEVTQERLQQIIINWISHYTVSFPIPYDTQKKEAWSLFIQHYITDCQSFYKLGRFLISTNK